jgi:hypothetical protein
MSLVSTTETAVLTNSYHQKKKEMVLKSHGVSCLTRSQAMLMIRGPAAYQHILEIKYEITRYQRSTTNKDCQSIHLFIVYSVMGLMDRKKKNTTMTYQQN